MLSATTAIQSGFAYRMRWSSESTYVGSLHAAANDEPRSTSQKKATHRPDRRGPDLAGSAGEGFTEAIWAARPPHCPKSGSWGSAWRSREGVEGGARAPSGRVRGRPHDRNDGPCSRVAFDSSYVAGPSAGVG